MSSFSLFDGESIFRCFGDEASRFDSLSSTIMKSLRVAIPAKITSINYAKSTCECQPLIRERLRMSDGKYSSVDLPLLLDVPIIFPGSSDYSITFPLSVGDEGLVIFADMCIDSWWQSGDIQDQFETRRHDLSDGFFIPAQMSQPKKYANISNSDLEIKHRSSGNGLKITSSGVSVVGDIFVDGKSLKTFMSKYNSHSHVAPEGGGTTSGPSQTI